MMYQSPHTQVHAAELVVAFVDGTAHARIPTGANVADICARVRCFSQRRQKTPLSVKVRFDVLSPNIQNGALVMLRKVLKVALAPQTPKVEIVNSATDQSGLSALRRHAENVASHDQRNFKVIMN